MSIIILSRKASRVLIVEEAPREKVSLSTTQYTKITLSIGIEKLKVLLPTGTIMKKEISTNRTHQGIIKMTIWQLLTRILILYITSLNILGPVDNLMKK